MKDKYFVCTHLKLVTPLTYLFDLFLLFQVPGKFRYPFYLEIMWYVADRYLSCLTGRTYLTAPEKEELVEEDQGLIEVDEDSRPPSRNPDSRPPSRSAEDGGDVKVCPPMYILHAKK